MHLSGNDGSNRGVSRVLRASAALAVTALAATTLAGCAGGVGPERGDATPRPAPSRVAVPNPLTGVGLSDGPVIAVKLDDTAGGRPSLGLEKADVIYIVEVEAGLSRMVAVFAGAKPKVQAVRSIRSSDPELLGQYGNITVVASGGGRKALRTLDQSTLHSVLDDREQGGFSRDPSRSAPYNVISDLTMVSADSEADGARNVGFTWAARDRRLVGARPATIVNTRVGSTAVEFIWEESLARYVRTVDGRRVTTGSGSPVAKPNVLVQFCQIDADLEDRDVNGNPTMFTKSVGSGRVVLFRGGRRIEGRWSRTGIEAPTTFTDTAGRRLLFAPGGTFVALVRSGAPA